MAYKVRRGDSWQTLNQQYPNLQSLNPTIKNVRPGMVLQTPFQYGMGGIDKQVNKITSAPSYSGEYGYGGFQGYNGGVTGYGVQSTSIGGRGSQPGGRPVYTPSTPTMLPDTQSQFKQNTMLPDTRDQLSNRTVLGGTSMSTIRNEEMDMIANGILTNLLKTYKPQTTNDYVAPAKGEPGYDRMAYLRTVLSARQIAKRMRRPVVKTATAADLQGDAGSYGQYNWRI